MRTYLKVVSATFLLVCFLSLNKSTCQCRKNVFYFTSKALFVLKKIKFQNSTFSNVMASSNAWPQNKKHISLNNLGSKYILLMNFGQFMSYYNTKTFIKTFYKKCSLKGPFCVCKELSTTSIGTLKF